MYRIAPDNSFEVVAAGETRRLNGVVVTEEGIVIVTFGTGQMYRIDATGQPQDVTTAPQGALDGVIALDNARYIVSSWSGSALYKRGDDGLFTLLADALEAPADIGYDSKRRRVMVPLFNSDTLVILPL
ncbi:MAG: hypothetical protein R3C68_04370 [Myxococcota bacterium]